ncbi:MAG: PCRF domain-containing protein, partial [Chloroflexota bacterium]|nr:PCRF domain-containing protein [Chloroflexota bacterium]
MTYRCDFDLPKQQAALDTLREKTQNPDFWADQNKAKTIMRDVARMEREISTWQSLETSLAENQELIELFIDDSTQELESEIIAALDKIEAEFQTLELRLKLGGAYDTRPALISVYAGSGGTDAQDWAELLLRMYIRWANSQKMETEIISITNGDEAGIKSADIKISGDFAYGLLQSEKGVHRLVRISPF